MSENQDPEIPSCSASPSPIPLSESASEPTTEADASATPSAAVADPGTPDLDEPHSIPLNVFLVDELRLIGIVCPLGSVVGVYFDSSTEDPVHNVASECNLVVRGIACQGSSVDVGPVFDALFLDEPSDSLVFQVPFDIVDRNARSVTLPPGFRRCFLGIRPAGTVEPRWAERRRGDFPPSVARRVEETWEAWRREHTSLPVAERPHGFVAWPLLPYCRDGMKFEIIQELEEDSL
ncbi:hypothetical protein NW762_006543 [Fusarium torreyae]|uniref:Uncharacterized protein n=1 Tax=Fusarium torreyae TaxID=1237075 RepID=A0A9W8S0A0_9HYPO|nr:hypothetical protein NW762_006543 [Fusarium torreyae]